jgi:hypothetical protein
MNSSQLRDLSDGLPNWNYSPDIQYKPGTENGVPDLLSRRAGPNSTAGDGAIKPQFLYTTPLFYDSDWPQFYKEDMSRISNA